MLNAIQTTVMQYAMFISQIIKVDVEVVDHNLFRIAVQGDLKRVSIEIWKHKGMSISMC